MLLELFWSFFQVGLLSIGGGYAALPIIREQIVVRHGFLTMSEFADVITIAEMTPGPIALNAATFVGTRLGGVIGALVATLSFVLPAFLIVLALAYFYTRYRSLKGVQAVLSGLRPGVVGLISAAGISIIALAVWNGALLAFRVADVNFRSLSIFVLALAALIKWKPSPILIIALTGAAGLALSFL